MISDKDLSIIVQGPILFDEEKKIPITQVCLARAKEIFPGAELILSTWEGSNLLNLTYDKLIISKDPGFINMILDDKIKQNNTNRMIISSVNGLNAASRKYAIKMRSDIFIENNSFINLFNKFNHMGTNSLVRSKIITLSANNYLRGKNIIFTINDWFSFGIKEDIIKMWDIPIQAKDNLINNNSEYPLFSDNLVAEDYIWVNFLIKSEFYRKRLNIIDNKPIKLTKENILLYKKSLAENVVLYDGKKLGINSLKLYNKNYVRQDFAKASCFLHTEWQMMYKSHVWKDHKVEYILDDILAIWLYILVFKFIYRYFKSIYIFLRTLYKNEKLHI